MSVRVAQRSPIVMDVNFSCLLSDFIIQGPAEAQFVKDYLPNSRRDVRKQTRAFAAT